jgi:hypothetical protein
MKRSEAKGLLVTFANASVVPPPPPPSPTIWDSQRNRHSQPSECVARRHALPCSMRVLRLPNESYLIITYR